MTPNLDASVRREGEALNLRAVFDKYEDEHREFERVENKLHPRPDLCAFLLLDKLAPEPGREMISAASHDEIFLDTNCDKLAEVATEADIVTLIRCGVRYHGQFDSLAMFV